MIFVRGWFAKNSLNFLHRHSGSDSIKILFCDAIARR